MSQQTEFASDHPQGCTEMAFERAFRSKDDDPGDYDDRQMTQPCE